MYFVTVSDMIPYNNMIKCIAKRTFKRIQYRLNTLQYRLDIYIYVYRFSPLSSTICSSELALSANSSLSVFSTSPSVFCNSPAVFSDTRSSFSLSSKEFRSLSFVAFNSLISSFNDCTMSSMPNELSSIPANLFLVVVSSSLRISHSCEIVLFI